MVLGVFSLILFLSIQDLKLVEKNDEFQIYIHRESPNEGLVSRLKSGLQTNLKHEIFKDQLPKPFAVILDDDLKATLGFHSPTIKSPEGDPCISLHPQAVSHDASFRTLIHELVHLAHEKARPQEQGWLQEGLAMMAELWVIGKPNPIHRHGFLEPESSLIGDIEMASSSTSREPRIKAQYGHLALFFGYAFKHCGKEALLKKWLYEKSEAAGIEFVDEQLKAFYDKTRPAFCGNFSELFRKFQRARFEQNPSAVDSYVLITKDQSPVRDARVDLEPYSAGIYREPSGGCFATDFLIRDRVCLQIRER